WDWKTGERLGELEIPEYDNGARCVIYSPDGALMATAGWGVVEISTVDLWDVKTNRRLRTLKGPRLTVDTIAFSPDGKQIAGGSRDGTVHLWDVQSGEIVRVIDAGEKWIYGVAFSPDGALIVGSCGSSAVLVWDAHTGGLRHRLNGLQSRANKVAVNP